MPTADQLAAELLAELELDVPDEVDGATLEQLIAESKRRWPTIAEVDPLAFVRHVAQRSEVSPLRLPRHASDLYLACGCIAGDSRAIAVLEPLCVTETRAAIRHMQLGRDTADEIVQRTRVRLLVAPAGTASRLVEYRGSGALNGWVRAIAIREALMWLRETARAARRAGELDDDALIVTEDPALASLKTRYRSVFRAVFERAMAKLSAQDRTLLRQVIVDRVPVEQLAALHGVHRVTASRWLQRIRRAVLAHTREELALELDASADELDSLLRLIDSQLELSVERILAP